MESYEVLQLILELILFLVLIIGFYFLYYAIFAYLEHVPGYTAGWAWAAAILLAIYAIIVSAVREMQLQAFRGTRAVLV